MKNELLLTFSLSLSLTACAPTNTPSVTNPQNQNTPSVLASSPSSTSSSQSLDNKTSQEVVTPITSSPPSLNTPATTPSASSNDINSPAVDNTNSLTTLFAPENVKVAFSSVSQLILTWDFKEQSPHSYRLYLNNEKVKEGVQTSSYSFEGLNPNTEYELAVAAVDANGTESEKVKIKGMTRLSGQAGSGSFSGGGSSSSSSGSSASTNRGPQRFTVTLTTPDNAVGPLSPGVFVVHKNGQPLFTGNTLDRQEGLKEIAEDGNAAKAGSTIPGAIVFNTPVGDTGPGPATPGKQYQFSFDAVPGDRLSFATMRVASSDAFYAPGADGIELFNGSTAIQGDLGSLVQLWDAGTEVNTAPGTGIGQPITGGVGTPESVPVQLLSARNDGFSYSPRNIEINISSTPISAPVTPTPQQFTLTLEAPAGAQGPLSPGVFVIHKSGQPLFTNNVLDRGQGLEEIAEDGSPVKAAAIQNAVVFNTPAGQQSPGPATPGKRYQLTFNATPGDKLSFATMRVATSDAFYAPAANGFDLFEGTTAVTGNIGSLIQLWDAGTEVNTNPIGGTGQPVSTNPAQTDESVPVQLLSARNDGFTYPSGNIKATLNIGAPAPKRFTVRLQNPQEANGPLSPGVFVIHREGRPIFTPNELAPTNGLEEIAEDGNAAVAAEQIENAIVFNTPVGGAAPGPALPGGAYEFSFVANPGDKLSFVTMRVASSDAFYAPMSTGYELFNGIEPATVSNMSFPLWDAGTEVNTNPVGGSGQPVSTDPAQMDENVPVQLLSDRNDGFTYTPNLLVTITATDL